MWWRHEQQTVRMALAAARRPAPGIEGFFTGGAVGHPCGARAAAERPQPAALRRRQPADPRPVLSGRVGRRGDGHLHTRLPHPVCPGKAGTRPSAATVSSSSGTVARAVRFGCFLPLPRGGRGRKGGRRSFLALAALVVDIGSGVFAMLVLLVPMHLVMCSLWSMNGPCCSATRPVWTKDSIFVVVMAVAYARLVLLVSLVALCSLVSWSGLDAPHHGRSDPEGQLFSGLVLLVILHLALCFFPCCQAQDACRQAGRSASWPV